MKNNNDTMNGFLNVSWMRLVSAVTLISSLLIGASLDVAAQTSKPRVPLETGFERKLGVVYKTVGKRQLEFDMYYPETGTERPCPVIVYTHGGGWTAGSRFGAARGAFAQLFTELVKEGFCIVSVDYRLYRKGGAIRMRDCVIDSKDAVRFLVKNRRTLDIDPDRIFVFGDLKNAGHNWRKVDAAIEPSREEIIQATVDFFVNHREGPE